MPAPDVTLASDEPDSRVNAPRTRPKNNHRTQLPQLLTHPHTSPRLTHVRDRLTRGTSSPLHQVTPLECVPYRLTPLSFIALPTNVDPVTAVVVVWLEDQVLSIA